jgi:hypothetical protein
MQNSRARLLRDKTPNLSLADVKARQSSKIREIGEALITAGFVSLDAQAKALGLPRSTAWTILSAEHKDTGISARIICRMLSSERLPPLVSAKIMEYVEPVFTVDEDAQPQICLEAQIERPGRGDYEDGSLITMPYKTKHYFGCWVREIRA